MPPKSSKASDAAASSASTGSARKPSTTAGKAKKAAGSTSSSSASSGASSTLFSLTWISALLYGVYFCVRWAYKIRLQAIEEYGPVIHEFDPWFNYRATEVCNNVFLCILRALCLHDVCSYLVSQRGRYQRRQNGAIALLRYIYNTLCSVASLRIFVIITTFPAHQKANKSDGAMQPMRLTIFPSLSVLHPLLCAVSLPERRQEILPMVRLPVMVSARAARRNHHLSRNAIHGRLHQELPHRRSHVPQ